MGMAPACREGELIEKSILLSQIGARQYHANRTDFMMPSLQSRGDPTIRFPAVFLPLQVGSPHSSPFRLIPVGRKGSPDLRCVLNTASHGGGPGPFGLTLVSSISLSFLEHFAPHFLAPLITNIHLSFHQSMY